MTSVEDAQAEICRALFGKDPDSVVFPGGRGRQTFIAVIDGEPFAVSRRSGKGPAALEAEVLQRLGNTGLVPRLLRHKGALLAQEYVPGKRLTAALHEATAIQQPNLLIAAAKSLVEIRRAAEKVGLMRVVPKIRVRQGWPAG